MKAIIVPVADRPECAKALVSAFRLAEQFDGNVIGYHLRPHRKEHRQGRADRARINSGPPTWQQEIGSGQIELDSKNARKLFDSLAQKFSFKKTRRARYEKHGGLALWHEITGDPEHLFSIVGPMSDLIVVSRPKSKRSVRAHAFAHAALVRTRRPVLMVPQTRVATLGNHILVAWNHSEESAAAVMASLPFLINAESVTLVNAIQENRLGPGVKHVQQYLQLYGVKVQSITTPGDSPEDEIVQAYIDCGADLLVMGAYSRPSWQEYIFGGVSRHIVFKTQLPTLMVHP